MEMTVEQALQEAVEVHKAGKLKDAEALYSAILQISPKHPDANHNLGVMAASLNKSEVAISHFKVALEANPTQGQFWLSYIDALIKDKQFDQARNILEQGKKRGLTGDKIDTLEKQLASISQNQIKQSILKIKSTTSSKKNKTILSKKEINNITQINLINKKSPPQIEINILLEYYKEGRYNLALDVAKTLTKQYPKYPFVWKVLGSLFIRLGKLQESLIAHQKVLEITPNDAELYSNLGITLKKLGKLEEAETNYKKAIAIKPDYAEAHINLGNILREFGRLEEAETNYKKAIVIKPDWAEAHRKLGNTLEKLGRLKDAETSYAQAIRLKPDFLQTRSEMLDCLFQMGKKSLFFDELDYLIKKDKSNSAIGSLTCRAALRYGEEKVNIFCKEPLKHVLLVDLKSRYNFEEIFVQNVKSILHEDMRSNRNQPLLSNGYQTSGNLFYRENNFTDKIQKVIRLEIERYQNNFQNSQEGFIRKWPSDFSLYGWLISMKSGGELHPHIHHNGWLSGSIYINVPPKSKINSGNLVVALGTDSDTTNSQLNPKKILNVVTGNMVLLPASLMHYTIPFESEEDRIVLAFDVVPKYFD